MSGVKATSACAYRKVTGPTRYTGCYGKSGITDLPRDVVQCKQNITAILTMPLIRVSDAVKHGRYSRASVDSDITRRPK